jgi:hypothetical protein
MALGAYLNCADGPTIVLTEMWLTARRFEIRHDRWTLYVRHDEIVGRWRMYSARDDNATKRIVSYFWVNQFFCIAAALISLTKTTSFLLIRDSELANNLWPTGLAQRFRSGARL